ncbi:helix-turn-helix domain-containing protein [Afifella sp. IM 167]|uniref:helix-turn-helix domain-containing protein n=1 Tax=Afifella sp. IM 167 TaxID=2033586 RepID=UPI001CC98CEA|nr:helix-turn-helix domain-containing protein [Afifella sp. IM 167]MBZ8133244.1 hypothetical protein [Afifella sp. IM 167]
MSAYLLGAAFRARMGTHCRKLVLLKLVDAAEDDGSRIYPAVATIATAAEASTRQVQRVLQAFVEIGLIRQVRAGGRGPGDSAEYAMDLDVLHRLAREGWEGLSGAGEAGQTAPEAAGNKGDTMSPLEKGDIEKGDTGDTQRVTPATDKGDSICHPTPPDPSLDPSIERERASAHAPAPADGGGGGGAPESDSAFQALLARWPTSPVDDHKRAFAAWQALSAEERKAAFAGVPAYLGFARNMARQRTCAIGTYLAEKRWERLKGEEDGKAPLVAVPAWSRDWWILLFRDLERGEARRFIVEMAVRTGSGTTRRADDLPGEAEAARFRKIERDSEAGRAWYRHLAGERGLRPLKPDTGGAWFWAPAEWPPQGRDAGARTEAGGQRAPP